MHPDTKVCYSCKQEKQLTEFYKSTASGHQKECKKCNAERKSKWHKTEVGKLSSANTKLKRRFGIDMAEYNRMLEKQEGKCLICESTESHLGHRLAVDHCHTTGAIRGLLCKSCNVGIGNLKDDINLVEKAVAYLKMFKGIK